MRWHRLFRFAQRSPMCVNMRNESCKCKTCECWVNTHSSSSVLAFVHAFAFVSEFSRHSASMMIIYYYYFLTLSDTCGLVFASNAFDENDVRLIILFVCSTVSRDNGRTIAIIMGQMDRIRLWQTDGHMSYIFLHEIARLTQAIAIMSKAKLFEYVLFWVVLLTSTLLFLSLSLHVCAVRFSHTASSRVTCHLVRFTNAINFAALQRQRRNFWRTSGHSTIQELSSCGFFLFRSRIVARFVCWAARLRFASFELWPQSLAGRNRSETRNRQFACFFLLRIGIFALA